MLWCSFPMGWDRIEVAMTTVISSHVKDKNCIFTGYQIFVTGKNPGISSVSIWQKVLVSAFRLTVWIHKRSKYFELWTRCFSKWDSLVLDRDSCFTGITITISNKITNLVTHSLYPLIATIFHFILSTFLRRFSYLWFLFASTSNRGRDLLFLLFFLLSGKICCWSWVSSQMTFSWRLVQCSIRTILKATKDRNSICNQLATSEILEIIDSFNITWRATALV